MSRVVHTLLFHFHSNFMKIYYLCFSYIMKLRLREENCPVMTQLVICRTSMWLYIWLYICLSSSDSKDCAIIPLSNVAKLDIWGLKAACKVVTWKLMMLALCLPDRSYVSFFTFLGLFPHSLFLLTQYISLCSLFSSRNLDVKCCIFILLLVTFKSLNEFIYLSKKIIL